MILIVSVVRLMDVACMHLHFFIIITPKTLSLWRLRKAQ